jgi:hypothetical protein
MLAGANGPLRRRKPASPADRQCRPLLSGAERVSAVETPVQRVNQAREERVSGTHGIHDRYSRSRGAPNISGARVELRSVRTFAHGQPFDVGKCFEQCAGGRIQTELLGDQWKFFIAHLDESCLPEPYGQRRSKRLRWPYVNVEGFEIGCTR